MKPTIFPWLSTLEDLQRFRGEKTSSKSASGQVKTLDRSYSEIEVKINGRGWQANLDHFSGYPADELFG
ncbi:MAG: hypothetical protein WBG35_03650, partial [Acidobacteriaceae bacterium]